MGYQLSRHEATFIQKIVQEISLELRFINSTTDGNIIGMDTRINEVTSYLEPNGDDVRMIGIWGMGGAGKTTLARAVFDKISIQFEGESFIENVREVSKASSEGLKKLQKQVLSDVLKDQNIVVTSVSGGTNMMQRRMRGIKVLVVLDDVDHIDQLEALSGDLNWFKPGSRVIITTREKQVLVAHQVSLIHDMTLLSQAEAGCLFSRHAFGRENPIQGYEELSKKVIQYAAGIPLTIKVMGSFLCGQSEPYWIDAIERLKTIPLTATMDTLEISFDGLEKDYKEIFLDVACILKRRHKEEAIRVLESRGFHAQVGLRVLEQKSLITISESGSLGMHDHLEEMGRNIVRRSHPDELQMHSRLWVDEEIEHILTNDLGTPATQYLKFQSMNFSAEIAIKGLGKMKDLKVLDIWITAKCDTNWKFDTVSEYLPSSLRFMRWHGYPFLCLPNTFQGKHLVGLQIDNIVRLWEDGEEKVLNNLRFLNIRDSKLRTFDLLLAPNLEQLTMKYCGDFVQLHLGNTPNLKTLKVNSCYSLVEFQMPAECLRLEHLDLTDSKFKTIHLGSTPNLKTLHLKACFNLVEFQMPAESLKLEHLDLSNSKLINLHLKNIPNIKTLVLKRCYDLVEFQMPAESLKLEHLDLSYSNLTNLHLENTPNLKKLKLNGCDELVELQMSAESLKLEHLDLSYSRLTNLHLGNTPNLKTLKLKGCFQLVEFQMPAESLKLERLDLTLTKLKTIHLGSTPNLERLILKSCGNLVLPSELGCVKSLKELNIERTGIRRLPQSIFQLKGLRIIGSREILESCGLGSKIQLSGRDTFCYI